MRSSHFLGPVLAAALILGACSDDDGISGSETGRFRLLLTDAPGDLAEANIQIESVVLLTSAGDRIELTPEVNGFINLINLQNGTTLEIIDTDDVPVGTYSELRVILGDSYVVLDDGRIFATAGADLPAGLEADGTLRCPSCSSSGFKVKVNGDGLEVVENSTFILDFDAAQSFGHVAGKSGQWIMHPVLRVDAETIRFGTISGTVTLASGLTLPATCGGTAITLASFTPTAVVSGGTPLTGVVNVTGGTFEIIRVLPGTYTIAFINELTFTGSTQKLTFTATPSVTTVTVDEGETETVNFVINTAVCA